MPKLLKKILLISLLIGFFTVFWLIKPKCTIAFSVQGSVITYDVIHDKFFAVWHADDINGTIVDVTVSVYTNSDGTGVVNGVTTTNNVWKEDTPGSYTYLNTLGWRYDNTGLMGVQVSGLNQNTQYYYKISVQEDIGGTISYHDIPPGSNDFISVHTMFDESSSTTAMNNPTRKFRVLDESDNTVDGAMVLIQVIGNYLDPTSTHPNYHSPYPAAGGCDFGWTMDGGKSSISFSGGTLFKESPVYRLMPLVDGFEIMRVTCLGGLLGNATIDIANHDAYNNHQAEFGCPSYPDDPSSCSANSDRNIINLAPNQAPVISITDKHGMRPEVGGTYVLLPTENFELDVRASDAESEAVSNWALVSPPGGMTITPQTDVNDAKIEWDPDSGDVSSTPYSVSATVQDINSNTGSLPFTILVTDGNPTEPDKPTITPANPITGPDDQNLVCTASGGSDPLDPGTTITYEYAWFKGGADQSINQNFVSYTLTTKGDVWSCSVKAVKPDNTKSAAVPSDPVTIGNTTATATFTLDLTNETDSGQQPTVGDTLRATVSGWAPVDPDPVDVLDYKLEWRQAGSLISTNTYTANDSEGLSLPSNQFSKGENIEVRVTLREDGVDRVASQQTASMTIQNTPPEVPTSASIALVGNDIVCTVSGASDADGDNLDYHYRWVGEKPSVADKIVPRWTSSTIDTLSASELSKLETWHCEIIGVRDDEVEVSTSVRNTAPDIYIDNTSPVWDAGKYPTISPSGTAYNDATLTCTVDADAATDNDGDTITYSYAWYKGGGTTVPNSGNTITLDPSVVGLLEQGESYYCEVTACDDSSACIKHNTNSVLIGNRPPTITVWKGSDEIGDGEMVQVTETEELVLTIVSDDADNNTLSSLDADADIPTGAVIQIVGVPNEAQFRWTPAQGEAGTYDVVFKVQETNGPDSLEITHSIQIKVIYPSNVIDNFEFQSDLGWYLPTNTQEDLEKRTDHGWSILSGSGHIYRKSYENDPDNHYMNMVTSESIPLKYIATLWLDPNETKDYYEVRCDIDTNSPYSFEAYVHVLDNVDGVPGNGKNYFLRYIPEDPSSGSEFEVDGMYINYYIGSEFIDPNGRTLKRNMEDDIHKAIAAKGVQYQSHYDYVWGFILRGRIDKFDNLEVVYGERDANSPAPPQTGSAVGIDQGVVLTWTDASNQDADVIGYEITWQKDDGQTYTPQNVYVWEQGISGAVKSCTIPFENNYPGGYYSFTIKAFDDAKEANYSSALELQATPHEDTIAPDMATCVFTARAPETLGRTINLTWTNITTNPNAANLSYYMLYMNDNVIATLDKTVLTYQVTGLVNDTPYTFKLEGYNGDGLGGLNSRQVTGTPRTAKVQVFDTFSYVSTSTPSKNGWSRLQGSGTMTAVYEDGNSCMRTTTSYSNKLNYIVTKFVANPVDWSNTKFHFNLKGVIGQFKIDLYVSDSTGKKYFMSYSPNAAYEDDDQMPSPCKQGMYITHYLGWKNNIGSTWHRVERDLQKDLEDGVPGATFGSFMGMVVRGQVYIDDIFFMRALLEPGNLVAISDDTAVDLFWTQTDPNADDFYLSVNGAGFVPIDSSHSLNIDGNQVDCTVTGLTNDTAYSFKVKQGNSSGVTVSATPHDFGFRDRCENSGNWTAQGVTLGNFSIEKDSGIHSDVLEITPNTIVNSGYLIRYFVGLNYDITTTGKSKISVNLKSTKNFMLWFTVKDTSGVEYNLLYASGTGTNSSTFGTWSFSYLPSCSNGSWIDGKWHTVSLDLNNNTLLKGYSAQVYEIIDVQIGGCDEVRVDNLGVY